VLGQDGADVPLKESTPSLVGSTGLCEGCALKGGAKRAKRQAKKATRWMARRVA